MRCPNCNEEVEATDKCPNCQAELNAVKVLSREEKDNFSGITIEQETSDEGRNHEQAYSNYQQRVYVKQVNTSSMSLLSRIVIVLITIFFLFVALPFTIVVIMGIAFVWWFIRLVTR